MRSLLLGADLPPARALEWLHAEPSGAVALVVTRAKGAGVACAPAADAREKLEAAAGAAEALGAARVLLWQVTGEVPPGGAVAIAGAAAEHRKDATRAVEALLAGLKGVAERRDR